MSDTNPSPERKSQSSGARDGMSTFVQAERLLQIAFVLPAAVLIGWGAGALLDKWLHTALDLYCGAAVRRGGRIV